MHFVLQTLALDGYSDSAYLRQCRTVPFNSLNPWKYAPLPHVIVPNLVAVCQTMWTPPQKKKKDAGLCYLVMRGIIDALETNTPIPTVTALPSLWID